MRIGFVGAAAVGGQAPYWLPGAKFEGTVSIEANTPFLQGFDVSSNGQYLYTYDASSSRVQQYTMSTPWDISTLSFTRTGDEDHSLGGGRGCIQFNPTGSYYYMLESLGSYPNNVIEMREFPLATNWDVSTAGNTGGNLSLQTRPGQMVDISGLVMTSWKDDGTVFYISQNNDSNSPWTYNLTFPWQLGFYAYDASRSGGNYEFGTDQFGTADWNADGTQTFTEIGTGIIKARNYSTAWDPTSFSGDDPLNIKDVTGDLNLQFTVDYTRIKNNGKKMYLAYRESGTSNNYVAEYTLAP